MRNIPTGWLVLVSLGMITIGYIAIGFNLSELLRRSAFIDSSLLVLVSVGTLLALVRGIGNLFPAIVVNAQIFYRQGLMALTLSAILTSIILAIGWGRTDSDSKGDNRQLLAYELLGGICIAAFGYFAFKGLQNVLSVKLLPIGAGLLGGFLCIFSELSNCLGIKQKQLIKVLTTLAAVGITIGLAISRLSPQTATPG